MSADVTTRLLLLGILICLIALVVQGFGGSSIPTLGRYQVTGTRAGAPLLIRTDTETGKVWKLELRGGNDSWLLFAESDDEAEGGAASADDVADTGPAAAAPAAPFADIDAPEPQGPKIKFAPRKPAAAPPAPAQPTEASPEEEVEVFAQAAGREDLNPEMRLWAVRQLSRVDIPSSTQALIEMSRTQDPQVARAAVEALGERQGEGIDAALAQAQSHPDASVQQAAREALAE